MLADLALRAVVAQEGIEASEEDVDAEIAKLAEQVKEKPQKVRRQLEQRGALDALRSDLARGSAMQLLIDGAEVVDGDGNPIDLSLPDEEAQTADAPDATDRSSRREASSSGRGARGVTDPISGQVIPNFIEQTNRGERALDPYTKLFSERVVYLGTPIDDFVANLRSSPSS